VVDHRGRQLDPTHGIRAYRVAGLRRYCPRGPQRADHGPGSVAAYVDYLIVIRAVGLLPRQPFLLFLPPSSPTVRFLPSIR